MAEPRQNRGPFQIRVSYSFDRLLEAKLAQAYAILVPCREHTIGLRVREFDDEDSGNAIKTTDSPRRTIPATFRLRFVVLVRLAKSSFRTNRLYKPCRVWTAIVRKCFPFSSRLSWVLDALADGKPAGNRGPLKSHRKAPPRYGMRVVLFCYSTLNGRYHGSHPEHLELVPCIGVLSSYLKIPLLWPAQLHQPYELHA
jgi:hypothetical protein